MLISKYVIAFVAVYGGLGGVFFDAVLPGTARQHQGNPAWPPHAKYHNAQSMVLGLLNMLTTLFVLFGLAPLTRSQLVLAAAIAEFYFASMLIAPMFPGTAWSDPEFDGINPRPLGLPIQKLLSIIATGLIAAAVAMTLVPS